MTSVRVLRVFTDETGGSGNLLGVVADGRAIAYERRQAIAAELAYSETVFVERGSRLQIFTPTTELAFAGHPLVGSAWLLRRSPLLAPAGEVAARAERDRAWVSAHFDWCPPFERVQLATPAEVDAVRAPKTGSVQAWAWADEVAGHVRARVFAPDFGVPEDPATGSAAIRLCAALGRALRIEQGPSCVIETRPLGDGWVELGGRVADDGVREL